MVFSKANNNDQGQASSPMFIPQSVRRSHLTCAVSEVKQFKFETVAKNGYDKSYTPKFII